MMLDLRKAQVQGWVEGPEVLVVPSVPSTMKITNTIRRMRTRRKPIRTRTCKAVMRTQQTKMITTMIIMNQRMKTRMKANMEVLPMSLTSRK